MWTIYYDGGEKFTDLDGDPEDAPCVGVQVIVQDHPNVGWHTQCGSDYYIWEDFFWHGSNDAGFYAYMYKPGKKIVKFGTHIYPTEYENILKLASQDERFTSKAGYTKSEKLKMK